MKDVAQPFAALRWERAATVLRHPANGKIPPKEKQSERPQRRVGLRLTRVVAETSQRDGINCTLLGVETSQAE